MGAFDGHALGHAAVGADVQAESDAAWFQVVDQQLCVVAVLNHHQLVDARRVVVELGADDQVFDTGTITPGITRLQLRLWLFSCR